MRVVKPVLGKKGDIKVNAGEILSKAHVTKMQGWKGLDAANPKGIEVDSSARHSGSELPDIVDHPERSPLVEAKAKQNAQSRITVPGIYDENSKCLNPSPLERELAAREKEKGK